MNTMLQNHREQLTVSGPIKEGFTQEVPFQGSLAQDEGAGSIFQAKEMPLVKV